MKIFLLIILLHQCNIILAQTAYYTQSININQSNTNISNNPANSITNCGNLAIILQYGEGNRSNINQLSSGTSNTAFIIQKGSFYNNANINQTNQSTQFQNSLQIYQLGSFNTIDYHINGMYNFLDVMQFGDINKLHSEYIYTDVCIMETIQIAFRNEMIIDNISDKSQSIYMANNKSCVDNYMYFGLFKSKDILNSTILTNNYNGESIICIQQIPFISNLGNITNDDIIEIKITIKVAETIAKNKPIL